MEYARLIINYNGQWDKSTYGFYNYKGGSSKGMRVPKNMTYAELLERIHSLVNVDLSKFKFKLKSVFQTSYRSPLVDIKDDKDVEFLLCEDRVIPQVGVTLVKNVDQSPRGADLHAVQPPVPLTHVKPTHFASEGNQVSGSVPATQPSQCTSTVQSTEIGEGCPSYYSDDPALSHFDQESSDGGSDHDFQPNMEHDSGPDSVNKDHHNHATSDRTPFHIPGLTSFLFASSTFDNHIHKGQTFPSKKELRRVLEMHALKENFDFRVRRSTTVRFEVGCSDMECKWRLSAMKREQGSCFQVRRYDSKHTCALDKTQRRRWQAKARKPVKKPRKQRTSITGEQEIRQERQCGKCGEFGHNRLRCKNLVLPENSSPRPPVTPGEPRQRKCRTCGVAGHNRQRCPNWEPPTSNENQKD
ncbi:hypothetical protein Ddye_022361 [Dipteronia dyeriana]|uniref:CCHC-type domain-containing protein n=1 Tax=Dipteronia dyeriana TaxID=168575 RepID=A0AAD9U432_9ROSI|nr:hypothetical protein Ddye_022361 [Dipteronia dyeriana]